MMNVSLPLLVYGSLSTVLGQLQEDCPSGFTYFNGSCYAFMQGKESWSGAEATCAAIRAHLVEIFSAEEMNFVQNYSSAHTSSDVWLGGHDLVQEGMWTWAFSGSDVSYTAWDHNQPNDHGDENCMELHEGSLLWNDNVCSHHKPFICQMSAGDN